ncbi:MAG: hypothetical protein JNN04_15160 [Cyclobacteriaceae bacterium]|nr:hypothetical protein [Cyclobacteriaceae bacterium]
MNWSTESLWLEVSVVSALTAVGNIVLGHFETGKPRWKRVLKFFISMGLIVLISTTLGRAWAFGFLGALLLAVVYIHAVWLPSKGINGWTAEPKEKYYKLRGWKHPDSSTNR